MDIEVRHVSKAFDGYDVLKDFSCTIPDGKITCIMGPSGCGKSTLGNILLGLLPPDYGTVKGLNGKRLAAVFQEDRLCENRSALSNIRLVCPPAVTRDEIEQALIETGLKDALSKPVSALSGGMRRRTAILRALFAPSDFILMDEPFKGLDKDTKELLLAYTAAHLNSRTLVLITHDSSEAVRLKADQRISMTLP